MQAERRNPTHEGRAMLGYLKLVFTCNSVYLWLRMAEIKTTDVQVIQVIQIHEAPINPHLCDLPAKSSLRSKCAPVTL